MRAGCQRVASGEQLYEQARASDKKDWEAPRVMFEKVLEKYPKDTVRAAHPQRPPSSDADVPDL